MDMLSLVLISVLNQITKLGGDVFKIRCHKGLLDIQRNDNEIKIIYVFKFM